MVNRVDAADPVLLRRIIAGRSPRWLQWLRVCAALMSLLQTGKALSAEPASTKRPFSVADSIQLARIVPLTTSRTVGAAVFSPDDAHFVLLTRRGDIESNENVDTLLLFGADEVARYLRAGSGVAAPRPQPLTSIRFVADGLGVSNLRWIGDDEIGFIAGGEGGHKQAFIASVRTREVFQLTHSDTDVEAFAISGDRVLYYARLPTSPPQWSVPLADRTLFDVLFWGNDPAAEPLALIQASRATGRTRRIDAPAVQLQAPFQQIWMSPSGNLAITQTPAVSAPAHWSEYRVPHYELFGWTADKMSDDPTSLDLALRTRYQLVDMRTNSARPLLDAPTGFLAQNDTPAVAIWADPSEQSVLVSNTFLPLVTGTPDVLAARRSAPAVAEIELSSGRVEPVVWEYVPSSEVERKAPPSAAIVSIDWHAAKRTLLVGNRAAGGRTSYDRFQRISRGWRRVSGFRVPSHDAVKVELSQSLNERPRLLASVHGCDCTKLLFDPAPEADNFAFGRVEIIHWTDHNGIRWRGGLVLPPGHEPGKRYPLVVQTHGFAPEEFLIDGPGGVTTAMAAQPLASAGIMVLQVEDNAQATTLDEHEAARFAEGYRAAVKHVVSLGLVDQARVGLIAFSRTGLSAIKLLADEPDLLAAVGLSDAPWWGYWVDLLLTNAPPDMANQSRNLSGGAPNEVGVAQWFSRNPLYRLPEARAAVRIEANGPGSLLAYWEHYSLLRNANRPVELVYFPQGSHVLLKPAERLMSQGGNVDWFRFWLQGYQDADEAKASQYRAWGKLRALRGEQ